MYRKKKKKEAMKQTSYESRYESKIYILYRFLDTFVSRCLSIHSKHDYG